MPVLSSSRDLRLDLALVKSENASDEEWLQVG
jgi:hypothetical protein